MPNCGSQILFCDLPIRFDTYVGCSHGCEYCFVYRKYDMSNIRKAETKNSLINFINGKRMKETEWCDWNIPLHWGGMSDPFQPCELKYRNSLECLKVFAETKYPFVVSTKSILPVEEPYFSLFRECNCVFQCSMICSTLSNRVEKGAPSFEKRLAMMEKMSKICKRTIVRCQPYILDLHKEIMEQIPKIANAGVYGITYEPIKMQTKTKGMIKLGADYVYPKYLLKDKWLELKEECHKYKLVFLSAENRLRELGDSLTCCGCGGLEGFKVNKSNLNYRIHKPEEFQYTKGQYNGCARCFTVFSQKSITDKVLVKKKFNEVNDIVLKDKVFVNQYLGN